MQQVSEPIKKKSSLIKRFSKESDDGFYMIATINSGIKSTIINELEVEFELEKETLAALLQVTSRTLDNYKAKETTLNPTVSEKILLLIKLYKKGVEVFGTVQKFNMWLRQNSYGLDGKIPLDILNTATGVNLVLKELLKIEFGDFS